MIGSATRTSIAADLIKTDNNVEGHPKFIEVGDPIGINTVLEEEVQLTITIVGEITAEGVDTMVQRQGCMMKVMRRNHHSCCIADNQEEDFNNTSVVKGNKVVKVNNNKVVKVYNIDKL